MNTKDYRQAEFEKVPTPITGGFKASIKISTPEGRTNWFAIEDDELEHIKTILLA